MQFKSVPCHSPPLYFSFLLFPLATTLVEISYCHISRAACLFTDRINLYFRPKSYSKGA